MRKSPLKKIGRVGEANRAARERIAAIAEEKGLNFCELGVSPLCFVNGFLAPAHRHKRAWYRGDVKKLSDYRQWVSACQNCHDFIETRPIFTEELFIQLRGKEE